VKFQVLSIYRKTTMQSCIMDL